MSRGFGWCRLGGGDAIALTAEGVSSGHPEWSPDGKWLAFLSARGGERRGRGLVVEPVGWRGNAVDGFSAGGGFAGVVAGWEAVVFGDAGCFEGGVGVGEGSRGREGERGESREGEEGGEEPWVIDRLQFKADEVGYLDHRRTHLYVFECGEQEDDEGDGRVILTMRGRRGRRMGRSWRLLQGA